MRCDAGADAEPHGDDTPRANGVQDMIIDDRRIGEQSGSARPAGARPVAAIVEGDHLGVRKQSVQIRGEAVCVPGVAAEAENHQPLPSTVPRGRNVHAPEALAVRRLDLKPGCGRRQERARRRRQPGREQHLGLSGVHHRDDGDVGHGEDED